jgi:CRP/FNR family cyclic AMP-dependent transcriptional regulator
MLPDAGFLADASQDLRDLLNQMSTRINLQDGQTLFEQGEDGESLYAVSEGAIELSVLSREGRKLSLDVLRPGTVFGEIALFDPSARTATAVALGPTTVLRVSNADLLRELRRTPDLAIDLVRVAGQRMRWMGRQLNEHVFLPMPSRLARKILHLTAHQTEEPKSLAMSQAEIAEFVGATREAVSKTLAVWKARGVIEISRGGIRILDHEALQAMADLDEL